MGEQLGWGQNKTLKEQEKLELAWFSAELAIQDWANFKHNKSNGHLELGPNAKFFFNKNRKLPHTNKHVLKQGVFFFATSCGYAFFMKYFLRENLCFYKTIHNWNIINAFHIDFKSVLGNYFVKIIKIS